MSEAHGVGLIGERRHDGDKDDVVKLDGGLQGRDELGARLDSEAAMKAAFGGGSRLAVVVGAEVAGDGEHGVAGPGLGGDDVPELVEEGIGVAVRADGAVPVGAALVEALEAEDVAVVIDVGVGHREDESAVGFVGVGCGDAADLSRPGRVVPPGGGMGR
ncbi:MAG: hypothetical protein IPF51_10755 [Dehalococcoidia bacterium]|uniref:hypothetical protein n=1 Tax=Candidatus Amarobacter glycogenicus TaxID=3140699 RepID=UPI0031358CD1|nr:hypothetical protein [Dehalococcoidia bacterium]